MRSIRYLLLGLGGGAAAFAAYYLAKHRGTGEKIGHELDEAVEHGSEVLEHHAHKAKQEVESLLPPRIAPREI